MPRHKIYKLLEEAWSCVPKNNPYWPAHVWELLIDKEWPALDLSHNPTIEGYRLLCNSRNLYYIPNTCIHVTYKPCPCATYAYCLHLETGKVSKHKIGNCPHTVYARA